MTLHKTPEVFGSISEIDSEAKLNRLLLLPKVIVYFQVNWSGPERVSRQIVSKALAEIGSFKIPVFKIDDSDSKLTYVQNWLMNQQKDLHYINCGGWGETVLLENGKITDFIGNPAKSGFEKTKR